MYPAKPSLSVKSGVEKTAVGAACPSYLTASLRRYLQHVPPAGQHRVRYFGWMHPSAKRRRMQVDEARSAEMASPEAMALRADGWREPLGRRPSQTLLPKPIVLAAAPVETPQWHLRCPHCERFSLVRVGVLPRQARAPPGITHSSPPRCSR